ncbi:MAG: snoRNA-binding rRNA-processing protein utp10 [Pycnora praestabilis]|nr:MAG: snoRNA-binding rRNA-processing protein utp10 [Pycnora praestabilis]
MTSSLTAQLSQIAANSTNSLNLKAQRTAHSRSLIFEPRTAANQDFDTIYQICIEGFQEICLLDSRFSGFSRSIFSEQSKTQDRTQMTAGQNRELDDVLESFLGLVGGKLLLTPAVKAVEWLVRRFRIHEQNTQSLLLTFLPYHTTPIFSSVLSILPSNLSSTFKFLQPYIRSLTNPPRHALIHAATNNKTFTAATNSYVLKVSKARHHHHALLSFWASIMTEAVAGMLDSARSGRQDVQRQSEEDVLLRILPVLNEALSMKKVPELRAGCYMLLTVLAKKAKLEDEVLTGMMEAVIIGWTQDTLNAGLLCLAVLAQERQAAKLPKRITKELLKVENLAPELASIHERHRADNFILGLVFGALDRLEKIDKSPGLEFVENILEAKILDDCQAALAFKSLLLTAQNIETKDIIGSVNRIQFARVIKRLINSESVGQTMMKALQDSSIDLDLLEIKLQTVVRPVETLPIEASKDEIVQDTVSSKSQDSFETAIATLPIRTPDEVSFLSHTKSHVFTRLLYAFTLISTSPSDLVRFVDLPILRKEMAFKESLYFSFFVRVWCGPYPITARAAALQTVAQLLKGVDNRPVDLQALLPAALVGLADSAKRIRRAAAELVVSLNSIYHFTGFETKKSKNLKPWGYDDIYGHGDQTKNVKWLSAEEASKLLEQAILPSLEECVLDPKHIEHIIETTIGQTSNRRRSDAKASNVELKQSLRLASMSFLSSHVINTPIFLVKIRLLDMLQHVEKVGSTSRTKLLFPVLEESASLDSGEVSAQCSSEQIDVQVYERHMTAVVTAGDKTGLQTLQSIVTGEVGTKRPTLIVAAFSRLRELWPSMRMDVTVSVAQFLLDYSLDDTLAANSRKYQENAMDILRNVQLNIDVLSSFVSQLPAATEMQEKPPAAKRRRTSHEEMLAVNSPDMKQMKNSILKIGVVLELVDSSKPEKYPHLLRGLFQVLGELQHYKTQIGSELGYLQQLVLGSLLSICDSFKDMQRTQISKFEQSAVRADLLTDCVRTTSSPQVQNAALLLVASLSSVAPELVLHSVMPIFTFMGTTVLRQDDEYSSHVIDQTIHQVIPPLIESLRKQSGDAIAGAAELLLSFVAAFEHVPSHRRFRLFTSLAETLGVEDFAFALLAMLAEKYASDAEVQNFAVEFAGQFTSETQFITAKKYLDLAVDTLQPKRTLSDILLSPNDNEAHSVHVVALNVLRLLPRLLSSRRLVSRVGRALGQEDIDAARLRDIFSDLLETTLGLADNVRENKQLHGACANVLESLLGLLSTTQFLKSIEGLIDRPSHELRRKVLKCLDARIRDEKQVDEATRTEILQFLPHLITILVESSDVLSKHAAIACIDQISEKFGKKQISVVATAAEIIGGPYCLGSKDERLQIMSLLCLASMADVLSTGIIPVLPQAVPKSLEHLTRSVSGTSSKERLHNAVYSFLGALLVHVPWMISGGYLDNVLKLSYDSAEAEMDEQANESRIQFMQLVARRIEAKEVFAAVERNWDDAVSKGPIALTSHLTVLSIAIERHPKSAIVKDSQTLSSILIKAFDLRRTDTSSGSDKYDSEDIDDIEKLVNDIAIKMIFKMNDTTFRPLFTKLLDWASSQLPKKDIEGRQLRLISLYNFMYTFFDTLKSIVTSYSSYIVENVVDILKSNPGQNDHSKTLWSAVIRTVLKVFEHDQDDFWQSPSHFSAICGPLVFQLAHAPILPVSSILIPTIVELAAAAESPDHHKSLNAFILKFLRAENSQVRLAAVKCEVSLTERLGEEWLSLLPEMLPFISELQEDDDEDVEVESQRWIVKIEGILGESLDPMLQ